MRKQYIRNHIKKPENIKILVDLINLKVMCDLVFPGPETHVPLKVIYDLCIENDTNQTLEDSLFTSIIKEKLTIYIRDRILTLYDIFLRILVMKIDKTQINHIV